jgi:protein arginine N-methyltransferase 1
VCAGLRGPAAARAALLKEVDESYFNSYSHFRIHREMISDAVRTDCYRDALEKNPSLIR